MKKVSVGSVFRIHLRFHPRVSYQIVPWLVKAKTVWFGIYDGEQLITGSIRKCDINQFNLFFKLDMEQLPKPAIVLREEMDATRLSEKELRHICSGLSDVFV